MAKVGIVMGSDSDLKVMKSLELSMRSLSSRLIVSRMLLSSGQEVPRHVM